MSFEDLQKQWKDQFGEGSPMADAKAEAELLATIRRSTNRFRFGVALIVLRDGLFFFGCAWALWVISNKAVQLSPEAIKQNKEIRFLLLGAVIALSVAANKLSPSWSQLTPSASGDRSALPGRIGRDRLRFDVMIWWRDLREAAAGFFLVAMTVTHARHLPSHATPVWIAAGLFAILSLAFLAFRWLDHVSPRPGDGTVLGALTRSIDQTRRQVRLLDNVWWYIGPVILGGFLAGPLQRSLVLGSIPRGVVVQSVILVVAGWLVWRINRWAARSRLRPRLEQLEKLKAELLTDAPSGSS